MHIKLKRQTIRTDSSISTKFQQRFLNRAALTSFRERMKGNLWTFAGKIELVFFSHFVMLHYWYSAAFTSHCRKHPKRGCISHQQKKYAFSINARLVSVYIFNLFSLVNLWTMLWSKLSATTHSDFAMNQSSMSQFWWFQTLCNRHATHNNTRKKWLYTWFQRRILTLAYR